MRQVGIDHLMTFREQLDEIRNKPNGNIPSIHVLEDFNFREIVWPDRLNKLNPSEGHMLIDILNDHGLEQLVQSSTREKHIGFNF